MKINIYRNLFLFILIHIISLSALAQITGDVNNDSQINIIDALLVAQFYVGLNPENFHSSAAETSGDGVVNIVDALLISQYYVGLITEFPAGSSVEPSPAPTPAGQPGNHEIIGYFPQWGIYNRNFHVKNLAANSSAEILTVINYAFGNIVDCECVMVNQSGIMDAYADYQKSYTASESVDGEADLWDQPLRGSFNQLKKLKTMYPHIKVLISLGGWTWSAGFHEAALTEANREKTVRSCIDIYIKGNLPVESYAGGPGAAAGIFNGIDIDWEYPNNPGNNNPYGPEDVHNFTLLLKEFRRQLDEIDPKLLLTIAGPAGQSMIDDLELDQIHIYLDWINLMTYDYHGGWETQGPANHLSPLFANPKDPSGNTQNSDYSVKLYKAGGTPADKLNLGIPFYGRGWQGVQNINNGLFQPANNPAPGTWEQGQDEYKNIRLKNLPLYWDSEAQASWAYDGNIFWSFDTPDSILNKMSYIKTQNLGGVMFWELSGDTGDGELIKAIRNGLQ